MDGYLEKRSGNFVVYQLRWVSREGHELKYYASREDKVPHGVIDLYALDKVSIPKSTSTAPDAKSEFSLHVGARVYTFRAKNRAMRDAWTEALAVWVPVRKRGDSVLIPRRIYSGIMACIDFCIEHGLDTEGLFRIPGSNAAVQEIAIKLYYSGNHFFDSFPAEFNVYDVASALKKCIRDLPEPILTYQLLEQFQKVDSAEEMKDLLSKLPERNREVIKKLFRLCSLLCGSKATLLTVTAISICLSPSIAPTEEIGLINMNSFFKIGIEQYDSVVGSSRETKPDLKSIADEIPSLSTPVSKSKSSKLSSRPPLSKPSRITTLSTDLVEEIDEDAHTGVEIKSIEHYYSEFSAGIKEEKGLDNLEAQDSDESELEAGARIYHELRKSERLKTDEFRSLVAHEMVCAQKALGENAELADTMSFEESAVNEVKISTASASRHVEFGNELKLERRRSALLAGRIVDLETKLIQIEQQNSAQKSRKEELLELCNRSEILMAKVIKLMQEDVLPACEEAQRVQGLSKRVSHALSESTCYKG